MMMITSILSILASLGGAVFYFGLNERGVWLPVGAAMTVTGLAGLLGEYLCLVC